MPKTIIWLFLLSLLFRTGVLRATDFPASSNQPPSALKVVAYVPNWIDLDAYSKEIEYAKLTHLNIAFENPINRAGDLSFNPKNEVLIKSAHTHRVKILLSIGGGSAADDKRMQDRYLHLMNDTNRPAFVAKLGTYVVKHGFDGLDVDIEGPSINQYYGAFIVDLSRELKRQDKLLTAALSQGYGGASVPDVALTKLDFVNIMAYDATGSWDPKSPGQHSSFDYATNCVAYWLKRGLMKSQAVLGVPFYGYGFGKAFRNGGYGYADILEAYPGAENRDQVGHTIWYNGIPTIKAKSRFVRENGLGGLMIWSLENDAKGKASLLSAMSDVLSGNE